MKRIFYIALILILMACGSASTEFDKNLMKWNESGVSHYRFQLVVGCFCPFSDINPLTIEVKDNQVLSMMGANGVEILDTDPLYPMLMNYATVDNLFTWTTDVLANADEVKVTYDATYGFPDNISVDYIEEAIDDEIGVRISNFEVLE